MDQVLLSESEIFAGQRAHVEVEGGAPQKSKRNKDKIYMGIFYAQMMDEIIDEAHAFPQKERR
jgi:hypothetical protein